MKKNSVRTERRLQRPRGRQLGGRPGVPALRPARKFKVVIFTGYSCNNNCAFCVNADKRDLPEKTTAELLRDLYAARAKGADIVELIGGEATLRPDFPALVRTARRLGIKDVVAATNGRVFSAPAVARAIAGSGIGALIFSVHGPDARTHDGLTRAPGSFRELVRGMENLRALGFSNISGNTTVVRQNMRRLPEIAGFYARNGIRNVEYIFVDPNYGGAKNYFSRLVPRISEAAPWMRKALDIGNAAGLTEWKVRYVPLCYFPDHLGQISEVNERRLFMTEHWAPDFVNEDAIASRVAVGRRKPPRCRGCALYDKCEGIWVEYLRRFGDPELKPVKMAGEAMAAVRRAHSPPEPNIFVTEKCGRDCLYCSARGEDRLMTPAQVREVLDRGYPALVFEGGEPLMSPGLERWVRAAARRGSRDITVLTNGLALTPARFASLRKAGVAHFHFNFPSHLAATHDELTGTRGRLKAQASVIKRVAASGPRAASLVCVINSLNYRQLPGYVEYAVRNFPGLFYIAFNFIKVKGRVKERPWLVPDLRRVRPYLRKALAAARRLGLPCLVDGVPLCFLRGFEAYARDADCLLKGDGTYLGEKRRVSACRRCGLSPVCAGPRADYLLLHGEKGFKAAPAGAARPVARAVAGGQLSLNKPAEAPL